MISVLSQNLKNMAILFLCCILLPLSGTADIENEKMSHLYPADRWALLEEAVRQGKDVKLTCGIGSVAGMRQASIDDPALIRRMYEAVSQAILGGQVNEYVTDNDRLIMFELRDGTTCSFRFNQNNLETEGGRIYRVENDEQIWKVFGEVFNYSDQIKTFSYAFGSFNAGAYEFCIQVKDGRYFLSAKGMNGVNLSVTDLALSEADMLELDGVLQANHVYDWNGFDEADRSVLDGYGFSLEIAKQGGYRFQARGYMKYPDGYDAAEEALQALLLKICGR